METKPSIQPQILPAQLVERNPTGLLNPLRVSAHDELDIISLASQIQTADANLKHSATGKLAVILDQIRMLQAQAKQILEETEHNRQLHSAACNFTKKPGTIYHLYERSTGQTYFSMLSPEVRSIFLFWCISFSTFSFRNGTEATMTKSFLEAIDWISIPRGLL